MPAALRTDRTLVDGRPVNRKFGHLPPPTLCTGVQISVSRMVLDNNDIYWTTKAYIIERRIVPERRETFLPQEASLLLVALVP